MASLLQQPIDGVEVKHVSTRIVRPRSTSNCCNLQAEHITLSLSDVALPPFFYISMFYAYQSAAAPTVHDLEAGLRKVLRDFEEFAGEYGEDANAQPCIHLNERGALFVHAEAHAALDHLLPFQPDPAMLALLPHSGEELLCVQVTTFACGGVVLGVVCNHQVADGEGLCQFTHAWAATVRGEPIAWVPCHDRAALMGARAWQIDQIKPVWNPTGFLMVEGLVRKRVFFASARLKEIKAQALEGAAEGVSYSTFVSLLSHVWKSVMIAQGLEDEEEEVESMVSVAVSLRKLLSPPLPEGYFGNAICHVHPQIKINDLVRKPLSFPASLVHDAIQGVKTKAASSATPLDVIQPALKKGPQLSAARAAKLSVSVAQHLFVTSWLRLPLYDLDFGRGTPVVAGNPFIPFNGLLIFMPSPEKCGGIAVDIALPPPCMDRFESIM